MTDIELKGGTVPRLLGSVYREWGHYGACLPTVNHNQAIPNFPVYNAGMRDYPLIIETATSKRRHPVIYTVTDAKTGEVLGQIEKFRRSTGYDGRGFKCSRVWFRLVGNESVNADTKSNIAVYLAGKRKYKIV